jgi:hypothetical protein
LPNEPNDFAVSSSWLRILPAQVSMVKDGVFKVLNHLSKVKHVEVQQDMARLCASLSANPENQVSRMFLP